MTFFPIVYCSRWPRPCRSRSSSWQSGSFPAGAPPRAAAASAAMHLAYTVWSAAAILRGLRLADCGCFGVFLARPLVWRTVAEDLVMTGLSVALVALARR